MLAVVLCCPWVRDAVVGSCMNMHWRILGDLTGTFTLHHIMHYVAELIQVLQSLHLNMLPLFLSPQHWESFKYNSVVCMYILTNKHLCSAKSPRVETISTAAFFPSSAIVRCVLVLTLSGFCRQGGLILRHVLKNFLAHSSSRCSLSHFYSSAMM